MDGHRVRVRIRVRAAVSDGVKRLWGDLMPDMHRV